MFGLNGPADGRLSPQFYQLMGARWIRLVLKPEHDLTDWIQDAHRRGLKVLGVIARESMRDDDWWGMCAEYGARYPMLDAVQPGNEPDHESPSSWTMAPSDLNDLLAAANVGFPDGMTIVGPGLVSGQPSYLDAVDLDLVDALAIHAYGRRPDNLQNWDEVPGNFGTLAELFDSYRRFQKPLWCTEWGVSTDQVSEEFQSRYVEAMMKAFKLRTDVPVSIYFCVDDGMV